MCCYAFPFLLRFFETQRLVEFWHDVFSVFWEPGRAKGECEDWPACRQPCIFAEAAAVPLSDRRVIDSYAQLAFNSK